MSKNEAITTCQITLITGTLRKIKLMDTTLLKLMDSCLSNIIVNTFKMYKWHCLRPLLTWHELADTVNKVKLAPDKIVEDFVLRQASALSAT